MERMRAIAADPLAGPRQRPAGRDRRLEAEPLGNPVGDQPLADPGGEVMARGDAQGVGPGLPDRPGDRGVEVGDDHLRRPAEPAEEQPPRIGILGS
ncbi:MAG: hypothetical protein ACT4PI_07120, partial [Actinomycetota bacterium]